MKSPKNGSAMVSSKERDVVRPYLKNAGNFFFIKQKAEVLALPLHLEKELPIIQSVGL